MRTDSMCRSPVPHPPHQAFSLIGDRYHCYGTLPLGPLLPTGRLRTERISGTHTEADEAAYAASGGYGFPDTIEDLRRPTRDEAQADLADDLRHT